MCTLLDEINGKSNFVTKKILNGSVMSADGDIQNNFVNRK